MRSVNRPVALICGIAGTRVGRAATAPAVCSARSVRHWELRTVDRGLHVLSHDEVVALTLHDLRDRGDDDRALRASGRGPGPQVGLAFCRGGSEQPWYARSRV